MGFTISTIEFSETLPVTPARVASALAIAVLLAITTSSVVANVIPFAVWHTKPTGIIVVSVSVNVNDALALMAPRRDIPL